MTLDEVIARLEALGTEQNRKIYRRHGAGENQFGVSIANIRALAKTIKRDQALADELWRTGNQDARTLATLIADPKAMAADDLDYWALGLDYYMVADRFSANVAGNHPAAGKKAEEWTASRQEYVAQAGWDLVGIIALKDKSLPDEYFEAWLTKIERGIHAAPNRARHAMNGAVIGIGLQPAAAGDGLGPRGAHRQGRGGPRRDRLRDAGHRELHREGVGAAAKRLANRPVDAGACLRSARGCFTLRSAQRFATRRWSRGEREGAVLTPRPPLPAGRGGASFILRWCPAAA